MEKIILVKPDLSYADEIQRYKKEFLEDEPIINGSAGLDRFSTVEDWLEELKKRSNKDTVPEGLVPSSTYLGIRKKDNYIVGMIDIRHSCGVRKSERKKGYAKQMIKLALEKCKELKIEKVLITCNDDNIASEKSIIACGGELEDIRTVDGKNYKRFWIEI